MAFWAKNAKQFRLGTSSLKLTAHEQPGPGLWQHHTERDPLTGGPEADPVQPLPPQPSPTCSAVPNPRFPQVEACF